LKIPPKPILTFTQPEKALGMPKTVGQHLRQRRLTLDLCLSEVAPQIGVSMATLGLWELDKVFPEHRYHPKIVAFLGYDPFPK
jgi:DNA-binding XRE family transcriptional regulator